MNIFYYSVHHILEDDEIRLLKGLGHNVFCFGVNRRNGATQAFRPSLNWNDIELSMFDDYERCGGTFNAEEQLPPHFERHFSLFLIMHDVAFIKRHWHRIRGANVVWRTIGQQIDILESSIAPLRAEGLKIVRYSPVERWATDYAGEDAAIRFYKDGSVYTGWTGEIGSALIFSRRFADRYPIEAATYVEIAERIPCALGGDGNETLPGAFGFVSHEKQVILYAHHLAYLYMTGLDIPYTFNFVEAWTTGIPVIIYAPSDRIGKFFEVDRLVTHEVDGFVCRTPDEVVAAFESLKADRKLAAHIGQEGRDAAGRHFGMSKIAGQWEDFLT